LTIDVAGHAVFLPALALAGLGVGFVAGMFGIGGGFILTPLLTIGFGIPAPIAVGSSLCQKIGTSAGSLVKYRQYRYGEPRMDWIMMGGSLVGTYAGTAALRALDRKGMIVVFGHSIALVNVIIELVYVAMLVATVIATARTIGMATRDQTIPGPLARVRLPPHVRLPAVGLHVSVPIAVYVGFVTGALSGLLGISGGVALLPVLIYGYGLSMRDAAGTGLIMLLVTVIAGTAEQAWHNQVDLRVALGVLAGSAVGAQLGARATHVWSGRSLRLALCALLSVVAAAILAHLTISVLE
jgi:uncharacterized membrane protein YfcA